MGIYTRYKCSGGLRALVEMLETVPTKRRQRMIDLGNTEDPVFTYLALSYVLTFDDILGLDEGQLSEVLAFSLPQVVGIAIQGLSQQDQKNFLRCMRPHQAIEAREILETPATKLEISAARFKMIQFAREAERNGFLKIKRIPENV